MREAGIYVVATIMTCLAIGCGPEPDAEEYYYYRNIAFRESPYASIRGIHPIDVSTKDSLFHYAIKYDDQNRITYLQQMMGPRNAVYQPDLNRFLVRSAGLRLSYTDDLEKRTYVDHRERPISTSAGVMHELYTYHDGMRQSMIFLDSMGHITENEWGIAQYQWTNKGEYVQELRYNLKGDTMHLRTGLDFGITRLYYDDLGYIEKFSNHDPRGALRNCSADFAIDKITYSDQGDFLTWRSYDKDEKITTNSQSGIAHGKNIYDNGVLQRCEYYDTSGELTMSHYGFASFEELKDSWGNLIGWKYYDSTGMQITMTPDVSYAARAYDDYRRITRYAFFDSIDNVIIHPQYGFAQIRYEYDDLDRPVSERYLDEQSQPVMARHIGAAILRHRYSPAGERITKKYDVEDQQIEE